MCPESDYILFLMSEETVMVSWPCQGFGVVRYRAHWVGPVLCKAMTVSPLLDSLDSANCYRTVQLMLVKPVPYRMVHTLSIERALASRV